MPLQPKQKVFNWNSKEKRELNPNGNTVHKPMTTCTVVQILITSFKEQTYSNGKNKNSGKVKFRLMIIALTCSYLSYTIFKTTLFGYSASFCCTISLSLSSSRISLRLVRNCKPKISLDVCHYFVACSTLSLGMPPLQIAVNRTEY